MEKQGKEICCDLSIEGFWNSCTSANVNDAEIVEMFVLGVWEVVPGKKP